MRQPRSSVEAKLVYSKLGFAGEYELDGFSYLCISSSIASERIKESQRVIAWISGAMGENLVMKVEKVKYVLWAADWERCLEFYRTMFGGEISFKMEVWSEIVIAGATIGVHGGGEGKRTWTGLSFQVDDLREAIVLLREYGGDLTAEPNDTEEDPLHLAMCMDTEGNEFMMTMKRR